jgi:2-keto-4-pentenoate hydratase
VNFGWGPRMLNVDQFKNAAHLLTHARLSSMPIDLAEDLRPSTESEAYALQAEVNRQLGNSRLGLPVGHKIGCTTPVMQAFLAIHSPCAGDIFAATVLQNNAQLSRARYRRLGVECEIVVELSRDIPPDAAPFTRETISSAVGAVIAGIEIVDDRYEDYRSLGTPTLIADNFFNAGCVLGDPVREWGRSILQPLRAERW